MAKDLVFTAEQKAAIVPMTLPIGEPGAARVGCLIGPPGSGKTSIAEEVMRIWKLLYGIHAITALSPTGKAARRFIEVTGFPCSTIHRMLVDWERSEGEGMSESMLRARAVIIDESSMIDQYLAERLLAVLPPSVERVLFVGDADQLPSVGPGCVLRDMMASGRVPVWKLTKIHRQSDHSWIRVNAQRINQGQRPISEPESEDYFEHIVETHDEVRAKVVEICKANPSIQVLVPGRRFAIGAIALNDLVREAVNPERGRPGWKAGDTIFHSQDRVIHKKNNYKLGVMNGETGIAVAVEKHEVNGKAVDHLAVDYGDRRVLYHPDVASKELKLAFALTVHSCVHPETIVETPNGLMPIMDIDRDDGIIATPNGPRAYDNFSDNPVSDLLEIETKDGYRLTVTPEHGVDVWTKEGFARTEAKDINPGSLLRLKLGFACNPNSSPTLPTPPAANFHAKKYKYPKTVTPELAEFLGLMVADGTLFSRGFRLVKRHKDVRDRFADLCDHLFGVTTKRFIRLNTYAAEVFSAEIASWLRQIGGMNPRAKRVPKCILLSPITLHCPFLKGLFEDGTVNMLSPTMIDHVAWSTVHQQLEDRVRVMLLRLGIITGATPSRPGHVYIYGENARKYADKIGFVSKFKNDRASQATAEETKYMMPITKTEASQIRAALVTVGAISLSVAQNIQNRKKMSRASAEKALAALSAKRSSSPVKTLLEKRLEFHYSPVRSVKKLRGPSMCINVPDGHRFLQNGFSAWNSQGSEYQNVLVVLHSSHSFLLSRELFYTACTRARQKLYIVGDEKAIKLAVSKPASRKRKTLLTERIQGACKAIESA